MLGAVAVVEQKSKLLSLPAEIRNIIYEYALTEDGGVVGDIRHLPGTWLRFRAADNEDKDLACESNQLRYVCRQLHKETTALGLGFNDITLSDKHERNSRAMYDKLDMLLTQAPPDILSSIRHINISDGETDMLTDQVYIDDLLSLVLVDFCRRYPQATVTVELDWLAYGIDYFEELMEDMVRMMGTLKCRRPLPEESHSTLDNSTEEKEPNLPHDDCPANLRFSLPKSHRRSCES